MKIDIDDDCSDKIILEVIQSDIDCIKDHMATSQIPFFVVDREQDKKMVKKLLKAMKTVKLYYKVDVRLEDMLKKKTNE